MFLLVPLLLIAISIVGILVLALRKKSYLDKLYTLNTAGNGSEGISLSPIFSWKKYGEEFFPEIKALINRLELDKYRGHWLVEAEKFLRRTRVISLRIDRWSDSVIKKIRRVHVNHALNGSNKEVLLDSSVNEAVTNTPAVHKSLTNDNPITRTFLKNEEERLIIEIAKNPKDAKLYESLGDTYVEMEGWVDAKESYEAAIELNPQDESLKQKLSSALGKLAQK